MKLKKRRPDDTVLVGIEGLLTDQVSDIVHDLAADHHRPEKRLFCLAVLWWDLEIFGFYVGRYLAHGDIVSRGVVTTASSSGESFGDKVGIVSDIPRVGPALKREGLGKKLHTDFNLLSSDSQVYKKNCINIPTILSDSRTIVWSSLPLSEKQTAIEPPIIIVPSKGNFLGKYLTSLHSSV